MNIILIHIGFRARDVGAADVVRNPLVARIVDAYDAADRSATAAARRAADPLPK